MQLEEKECGKKSRVNTFNEDQEIRAWVLMDDVRPKIISNATTWINRNGKAVARHSSSHAWVTGSSHHDPAIYN